MRAADPIVAAVQDRLAKRSEMGRFKYGFDMTRRDLSCTDWLRHAQEEAMDLSIYLERVIQDAEAAEAARLKRAKGIG